MALMWNRTVDWDADDWRRAAACRNTEPDLFFPVGTTGPSPSIRGSWWMARAPSAVRRTSSSTPSAPNRLASAKASSVFSTNPSVQPRWAKTAVIEGSFPSMAPIFTLPFENFTKLLASTAGSRYPLLVNPFSVTDTNLGSIM